METNALVKSCSTSQKIMSAKKTLVRIVTWCVQDVLQCVRIVTWCAHDVFEFCMHCYLVWTGCCCVLYALLPGVSRMFCGVFALLPGVARMFLRFVRIVTWCVQDVFAFCTHCYLVWPGCFCALYALIPGVSRLFCGLSALLPSVTYIFVCVILVLALFRDYLILSFLV